MIHNRQRYEDDNAYRDSLSPDARALYDLERLDSERYYADIRPTAMVYVTIYCRVMHYGGPAEGGWWYDTWDVAEEAPQFRSHNSSEAVAHNKLLAREWCEVTNASMAPYHSVNGGIEYVPLLELKRGTYVDVARQRYS